MRALQGDAPKRLPKKLGALPAMELVEEIIEVSWRRLLMTFQAEQRGDVLFVEWVHAVELGNGILTEFFQVILQLAVRVEEPRTYCSFRDTQDLADLGVGHSLNMKHRDHSSVFIRQFHHCLVQSYLELG